MCGSFAPASGILVVLLSAFMYLFLPSIHIAQKHDLLLQALSTLTSASVIRPSRAVISARSSSGVRAVEALDRAASSSSVRSSGSSSSGSYSTGDACFAVHEGPLDFNDASNSSLRRLRRRCRLRLPHTAKIPDASAG